MRHPYLFIQRPDLRGGRALFSEPVEMVDHGNLSFSGTLLLRTLAVKNSPLPQDGTQYVCFGSLVIKIDFRSPGTWLYSTAPRCGNKAAACHCVAPFMLFSAPCFLLTLLGVNTSLVQVILVLYSCIYFVKGHFTSYLILIDYNLI